MKEPTVPCRLCSEPTPMLGTKLCDRCWELETRITRDPSIAYKILVDNNYFSRVQDAIRDAIAYVDDVVDDRYNSPLPDERREELVELLSAVWGRR